nr:MAG TPA: hypothetical protein [Caudoviricetes sp.]
MIPPLDVKNFGGAKDSRAKPFCIHTVIFTFLWESLKNIKRTR